MISLEINGVVHQVTLTDNSMPLLWVLRDVVGLTGTKYGCGIEVCGACTVLIDGEAQRSCQIDVSEAVGRQITTVEGLSSDGLSHPLQKAWIQLQVPQCGYCQSGMLMSACSLLQRNSAPQDDDISEISNVCVCGTYQRIREAIKLAATL
jgi:isoquinoline 1-oxidoreductase alpha subunit